MAVTLILGVVALAVVLAVTVRMYKKWQKGQKEQNVSDSSKKD